MGCIITPPANQKYSGDKKANDDDLHGKTKYIGDVGGSLWAMKEEKGVPPGMFVLYLTPDERSNVSFTCYNSKTDKVFAVNYTDVELSTKREECHVTFSFNTIFKSLATDVSKGKIKLLFEATSCAATFSISSVKDAKVVQFFTVHLHLITTPSHESKAQHVLEPLTRMVQKRRQTTEESEKEMKVSRFQMQNVLWTANMLKNRTTVDRVQKIILLLREQSAQQSKTTAELVTKVEQVERRIRKLTGKSGAGGKHLATDGMLDEGGARYFSHLPDAEEHFPSEVALNSETLEVVKSLFPLNDMTLASLLTQTPSNPTIAKIMANNADARATLQVYQKLDEWDMSVFDLEKATNGNALFNVTYTILYKLDLVNHFNLDDTVLRSFLTAVQAGYHPNPYHNKTHAADVTQINYFILTKGGLAERCKLSKSELLGAVLAGAIHDYDHPGFNNNFHTRTNAYLSTLYNDRSILENHHCACVFELMRQPMYNLLAPLTEDQRREVRDTMIETVLATDMGNHAKIFSSFRRRLAECQDWHERKEDLLLALSMSMKMADVSNCGRPKFLYLEWAKNIATEFYNQGDHEEKRSLIISPFMDRKRDKTDFPKGQTSFMNFVVVPMFESIAEFLPPVECALQFCTENKEYWQRSD